MFGLRTIVGVDDVESGIFAVLGEELGLWRPIEGQFIDGVLLILAIICLVKIRVIQIKTVKPLRRLLNCVCIRAQQITGRH